jgi:hypothetical protein
LVSGSLRYWEPEASRPIGLDILCGAANVLTLFYRRMSKRL